MFYGEDFANDGRRNPLPNSQKVWEPKSLSALHLRIIQLVAGGLKNGVIAEVCGCTPQTVSNVRNSELGKRKLRALMAGRDVATIDVRSELERLAKIGVDIYRQALEGDIELQPKDQIAAARDVIDRAGYSPRMLHLHAHQHQHFTPDEIAEIKKQAKEAARANGSLAECDSDSDGDIIDAEVIPHADD